MSATATAAAGEDEESRIEFYFPPSQPPPTMSSTSTTTTTGTTPAMTTSHPPMPHDTRMAKLVRERSTAQKRRKIKRDELTILGSAVEDLEHRRSQCWAELQALPAAVLNQVMTLQASTAWQQQQRAPTHGCRLCSILDVKTEEFDTVDLLLHHMRGQHASEVRPMLARANGAFDLLKFSTDASPVSTGEEEGEESGEGEEEEEEVVEQGGGGAEVCDAEMKRKMRLKRNAASARKSRKRKRLQLERWRMYMPQLRFQVESLEATRALAQQFLYHEQLPLQPLPPLLPLQELPPPPPPPPLPLLAPPPPPPQEQVLQPPPPPPPPQPPLPPQQQDQARWEPAVAMQKPEMVEPDILSAAQLLLFAMKS